MGEIAVPRGLAGGGVEGGRGGTQRTWRQLEPKPLSGP